MNYAQIRNIYLCVYVRYDNNAEYDIQLGIQIKYNIAIQKAAIAITTRLIYLIIKTSRLSHKKIFFRLKIKNKEVG
jgi:hypothetical protein